MNKHTPEPWEATDWKGDISIVAGRKTLKTEIAVLRDAHDEIWVENAQANAARIVACVNACENIHNETLADMSAYFGKQGRTYYTLVSDMRAAQAQRDELLEANSKLKAEIMKAEEDRDHNAALAERIRAERDQLLKALESIAELRPVNHGGREKCFAIAVSTAQTAVFGLSKPRKS